MLHTIKQLKLEKNSFTLFETLISIFILSIVIVGFSKISSYDNFDEEFMTLNKIENSFNTKNYSTNFSTSNETVKIIKNDLDIENLNVKKTIYSDDKIVLIKYELQ